MPLAQQAMLWAVGGFAAFVVLWLSATRKNWREELGDTGDLDTHIDLSHPLGNEPRHIGKHPALGAGYRQGPVMRARNHIPANWPTRQIILTPRHLEHVNILRRRDGKPPMNAAGFRAAIAEQARTGTSPIHPTDEWLAYLIAFELFDPDHQSHRVAVDTTIAIEPDRPFNGQFGGAGATGSFDPPADPYAAFAAGAALAGAMPGPDEADAGKADPPQDDALSATDADDPPDAPSAGDAPDTGGGGGAD